MSPGLAPPYPWWRRGNLYLRGLPRRGPVGPREAAIIPLALRRVRNLGGTRGRGPEGPARPDLARRPTQKRKGVRAARVVRGTRSATRRNPTVVVHRRDARSSQSVLPVCTPPRPDATAAPLARGPLLPPPLRPLSGSTPARPPSQRTAPPPRCPASTSSIPPALASPAPPDIASACTVPVR